MPRQVGKSQDLRMRDQLAQHAAADREVADRLSFVLVEADGEEAREPIALVVQKAERGVAGPGQLLRGAENAAQNFLQIVDVEQLVQDRDQAAGGPILSSSHWCSGLEQVVLDGVLGELRARRQVELALDARPVRLDGAPRQEQLFGDLGIRVPERQQP